MAKLISLKEASWRLEQSEISGRMFAELLVKSEPLLLGVRPGNSLHDRVNLSNVTSFRAEPENAVVADGVRWTDVMLDWSELVAAFKHRARPVSWTWHSDITPEMLERARRLNPGRPRLDDLRPPMPLSLFLPPTPQPARRASPEWFAAAVVTSAVPLSGNPRRAKRGPKSQKRGNAAAAIRKDLEDGTLTVAVLEGMPEKRLASRYGVSRDTARKARNDTLLSFVGNSMSTNDN